MSMLGSRRVQSLNNLPYTEFAAGQATAEQTAWTNVQTAFNSTVTSINGETSAYDNHVAGQITGLTSNAAGAQQTYIGSVAPAIETRDTGVLPVSVCKVFLEFALV